MYRL
ncbi:protein yebF, partial [Yersinia pestis PY-100]|jgi:hypothetical protein